jgi:hypothetical protein
MLPGASATGLKATSTHGIAVDIFSTNNSAIRAITNSNANGYAIDAQAASNYAIVGTTGAASKAGVWGKASSNGSSGVYGTTNSASGFGVYGSNPSGTAVYGFSTNGTGVKAVSTSGLALDVNGNIKIAGGNTNPANGALLTSDASGNASWKAPLTQKVGFCVRGVLGGGANVLSPTTSSKVPFAIEQYDPGNDYTTTLGTPTFTFTVPVSGFYRLNSFLNWGDPTDPDEFYLRTDVSLMCNRGGSVFPIARSADGDVSILFGGVFSTSQVSTDVRLLAGDKVWVECSYALCLTCTSNGTLRIENDQAAFSGYLIFSD